MFVTVAICTWNRADLLDQTLTRMRDLRVPKGVEWELLVVNNNCTDHTDDVIERHAGHLPLRRLLETNQGHTFARNCAINAARGELLVWTDDDVLVDSEWLAAYVEAARIWPEAGLFGGPIEPNFEATPPQWIRRHMHSLQGMLVIRTDVVDAAPITDDYYPYGANMAMRTQLLRQLGGFDTALGRRGSELTSGDDIGMIKVILASGAQGRWVAGAKLRHFVGERRCCIDYFHRLYRGFGITGAIKQEPPLYTPMLFGRPRWALRQYISNTLASWIWAPFRNERWLESVKLAARAEGYMEGFRRRLSQGAG